VNAITNVNEFLEGTDLAFRQPTPADLPGVCLLAYENTWSFRWAYRDTIPPVERFQQTVWVGTICRYIIEDRLSGRSLGIAVGWTDNALRDSLKIDIVLKNHSDVARYWLMAATMLASYIRGVLDVNKITLEIPGKLHRVVESSMEQPLSIEGRIDDYFFLAGELDDLVIVHFNAEFGPDEGEH